MTKIRTRAEVALASVALFTLCRLLGTTLLYREDGRSNAAGQQQPNQQRNFSPQRNHALFTTEVLAPRNTIDGTTTAAVSQEEILLFPPRRNRTAVDEIASQIVLPRRLREFYSPLDGCNITAQVRLIRSSRSKGGTLWTLQSVDVDGNIKTQGGDEFYVSYTDQSAADDAMVYFGDNRDDEQQQHAHATAVAKVIDHRNGTYGLDFVATPLHQHYYQRHQSTATPGGGDDDADDAAPRKLMGIGNLTIHFQYTCGIGGLPQMLKWKWKSGAASTGIRHTIQNVRQPPIRPFELPPNNAIENATSPLNLANYDLVVAFGDSVMRQFFGLNERLPDNTGIINGNQRLFEGIPFGNDQKFVWSANLALQYGTANVDEIVRKLERRHGRELRQRGKGKNGTRRRKVALLMGSALWDILHPNAMEKWYWEDHLEAIRAVIARVRARYVNNDNDDPSSSAAAPDVTILWKAPSALHVHRVRPDCITGGANNTMCVEVTRHMSQRRVTRLYQYQKKLMRDLGVPFLDTMEAYYLSGDWTTKYDGRHYRPELNQLLLSWFYRRRDDYPNKEKDH